MQWYFYPSKMGFIRPNARWLDTAVLVSYPSKQHSDVVMLRNVLPVIIAQLFSWTTNVHMLLCTCLYIANLDYKDNTIVTWMNNATDAQPVCASLCVPACVCQPVCASLCVPACVGQPVSLCRPACVGQPVSASLCRPACVGQPVSASLCRPACVGQPVSASLCRPASVGQPLSASLCQYTKQISYNWTLASIVFLNK